MISQLGESRIVEQYDIVIVGAGPAGLQLSRELRGLRVLVLDRKRAPEDVQYNTAGSFINPHEWGIPDGICNPITTWRFFSRSASFQKPVHGWVINRRKLLAFMDADARRQGTTVRYETIVTGVEHANGRIESITYVRDGRKGKVQARIFADCSGTGVALGNPLGIAPLRSPQAVGVEYLVRLKNEHSVVDLIVGSKVRGGYGWVFPLDKTHAIVGAGTLDKSRFSQVEDMLRGLWDLPEVRAHVDATPIERYAAVLRTGSPPRHLVRGNLILVGDTAMQSNPLVGEGIRFAMRTAHLAADPVRQALREGDGALARYERAWRAAYARPWGVALRLQDAIRAHSKSDRRMDVGVRFLARLSTQEFSKLLRGEVTYRWLISVGLKRLFVHAKR